MQRPDDYSNAFQLDCLVADDGAFTLGADLLAPAADGFALLGATRERRDIRQSAGKSIQTIASVHVYHRFWLGAACDGAALMASCQAGAASINAEYAECGVPPQPIEVLCPDYLLESCGACPEYFDCVGAATRCESDGLYNTSSSCSCP